MLNDVILKINKVCPICGTIFIISSNTIRKYCSIDCLYKSRSNRLLNNNPMKNPIAVSKNSLSRMGRPSPLKGRIVPHKKGHFVSPETKLKISIALTKPEKENPNYRELHLLIENKYGKAKTCEINSAHPGRYEWANISRTYKKDKSDWIQLCAKCHKKFDGVNKGGVGISVPITLDALKKVS